MLMQSHKNASTYQAIRVYTVSDIYLALNGEES